MASYLHQVSPRGQLELQPDQQFVGASYQLDRGIDTFVVNNTYVMNSSTVLTLRGGYNQFDDNYILPQEFDAAALFNNPGLTSQMSDTEPVPDDRDHRVQGHGLDGTADQRLLPVRDRTARSASWRGVTATRSAATTV